VYIRNNPTAIMYCGTRMKLEARSTPTSIYQTLAIFPMKLESRSLVPRLLLTPVVQKLCTCKYGVFRCKVCSFSNISSKFVALREAVRNTYVEKEGRRRKN
jgi:hypothetical protein